jgi:hypothetical protein
MGKRVPELVRMDVWDAGVVASPLEELPHPGVGEGSFLAEP